MPKTRLRQLLEELHDELAKADRVDPEAQSLLQGAMDEIRSALDQEPAARKAEDDEAETLNDRLNKAVVEFENDHPQLAFSIRQVLKLLEDIGI